MLPRNSQWRAAWSGQPTFSRGAIPDVGSSYSWESGCRLSTGRPGVPFPLVGFGTDGRAEEGTSSADGVRGEPAGSLPPRRRTGRVVGLAGSSVGLSLDGSSVGGLSGGSPPSAGLRRRVGRPFAPSPGPPAPDDTALSAVNRARIPAYSELFSWYSPRSGNWLINARTSRMRSSVIGWVLKILEIFPDRL